MHDAIILTLMHAYIVLTFITQYGSTPQTAKNSNTRTCTTKKLLLFQLFCCNLQSHPHLLSQIYARMYVCMYFCYNFCSQLTDSLLYIH